jgi:hypothetical protein
MRKVVARKEHCCSKCGGIIKEGEACVQSERFYGRFFHTYCTTYCSRDNSRISQTVKELDERLG